jgi:Zn finger protein HypA/HybF involved in hydrogenase expression
MVAAELLASVGVFKSLYDSAKALKDINDAAIRNAAVIDLQEKILTAREAQEALLERVADLETKISTFDKWETEKARYALEEVSSGAFVYSLKAGAVPDEPPHKICASCYQKSEKSILQIVPTNVARSHLGIPPMYRCNACKGEVVTRLGDSPWRTGVA